MSPRGNRCMQDGITCHLTARCHNRSFLLRYGTDRDEYRRRLRKDLKGSKVSLLGECVTSNHVHMLAFSTKRGHISALMQRLQGEYAEWYNYRHLRGSAFWGGRYHGTMVQSGSHLWRCLVYIELNMVRAGVVKHPVDWRWCSYAEHVGSRQRYRLLDIPALVQLTESGSEQSFREDFRGVLESQLGAGELVREPEWTNSVAVGDHDFVRDIAARMGGRVRLDLEETQSGLWVVRESERPYGLTK